MSYTITAKDSAQFSRIEEELNKLPEQIKSQIENARMNAVGIECVIRDAFRENQKIVLPTCTTQIEHFGDYIGVYSRSYFFRIEGSLLEKKISYLFVDIKK